MLTSSDGLPIGTSIKTESGSSHSRSQLTSTPFMEPIPCLQSHGTNFDVWNKALRHVVSNITENSDYLKASPAPNQSARVDRIVFSVIVWSIDIRLRVLIECCTSARQAFRVLARRFSADQYEPPRISISDLPTEVLNKIIEEVDSAAGDEAEEMFDIKVLRLTKMDTWKPTHWVYEPSKQPELNSVQALGTVNRRFHTLCSPWLWKKICFPTSIPAQLEKWTKDLLPKYGTFVQVADFQFSADWYLDPLKNATQPKYDNTLLAPGDSAPKYLDEDGVRFQLLSPASITALLVHCPNLIELEMDCDLNEETLDDETEDAPDGLEARLITLFSRLPGLRRLTIKGDAQIQIRDECMAKIIEKLPLLETISCDCVERSPGGEGAHHLMQQLSQLKHLTSLQLEQVESVDGTWALAPWRPPLKVLKLVGCSHFAATDVHQLICCLGSQLTQLKLDFYEPSEYLPPTPEKRLEDREWMAKHQLCLPLLYTLKIRNDPRLDILSSFQECKALRTLVYDYMSPEMWCHLADLVCASTWPCLKILRIDQPQEYDTSDWDIVISQNRLKEFCETKHIIFLLNNDCGGFRGSDYDHYVYSSGRF
ncbi:hypothetical protein CROQUDRAFT_253832 [Cronartium quercuum f. sp. fusiforme G11]|uniref:Uncharacterized protein n=1 Tax=Cronartium quercuum f. sp. fusiforme G11 TaxID=708437 RepID=A0A9P6N9G9_9BASI|nr:hypothetical protein CROQUDRAFT_253832 [Cronartium quercuum f. sp. fusiforme G11]